MSKLLLKEGDVAPPFVACNQEGKTVSLKDFQGKKVCLYFYPKDDTPGCTAQACSLKEEYASLQAAGWVVLGVSVDSVAKHKKFAEKYSLPFSLLADEPKEIVQAYGVWGEKKFMGKTYFGITRTTFLIDEKGYISKIIQKPNTANHAQEVLA